MTAAAHPKAVPIELGGRTRYLLFTLGAFAKMDREGIAPYTLTDEMLRQPRWQQVALWAGLTTDDPTLTLDEVGTWVDLENFATVMLKVTEAFTRSAGQTIRGPDPLPAAAPETAGTGNSSTSSPTPP